MAGQYQDRSRTILGVIGIGARARTAVMLTAAGLAGCGHADDSSAVDPVSMGEAGNGGTISPIAVDGVWVFRMSGGWGEQALITDEVRIEDGCLLLGSSVAIWSAAQVSFAAGLVADVRSGGVPNVSLGGGESNEVPAVVAERCAVDVVWRVSSY